MSIRTRLSMLFAVCFGALLIVCAFSIFQIERLHDIARAIDVRWLPDAVDLGEAADSMTEFRLAETTRVLAPDAAARQAAEKELEERREIVNDLTQNFAQKTTDENRIALYRDFVAKWQTYLRGHDAWMAGPVGDTARDSAYVAQSASVHHVADEAIDAMIGSNTDAADAATASATSITSVTLYLLLAISAAGFGLAGWAIFQVRRRIADPLSAITGALTDLAMGRTDVEVPGTHLGDEIGRMTQAFEIFRRNAWALSRAREAAETAQSKAQMLAREDPLTHLPNRRVFAEEIAKAIVAAKAATATWGIFLIDLDRFKPVNDIHGHAVGDLVLTEVATRLKQVMPKGATVARLGGDEFAVIARCTVGQDVLAELATAMIKAIEAPIQAGPNKLEVGATIGISRCPADGTDTGTLLRAADIAMYRAKREGRGGYRFFEAQMEKELRERATLESDIRAAVAAKQIVPFYQPLVALADNRLTGFEVLARWRHPTRGNVSPIVFIPILEEIGLIGEFTLDILRRACLDARDWPPALSISLNVSPLQLRDALFPARVIAVFAETGFNPRRLELEITESALVEDLDSAKAILASLQDVGVRIALDDFGTGYSSLYHLRELNLDKLKIDRSFILSMREDAESEKLVNGILGLSRSLGLPTTAEGIEDPETLALMVASGCESGQGFYFARAMPAADAALLARRGAMPGTPAMAERAAS